MPQPQRDGDGWRVNFRYNGVRHRRVFSTAKYADPEAAARAFIESVLSGSSGLALTGCITEYLSWAELSGKLRPNTITTDRRRLTVFAQFSGDIPIDRVDLDHLLRFQRWFMEHYPLYVDGRRRHRDLPESELTRRRLATWEKYRLAISALLRWGIGRGYSTMNPAGRAELKTKPRRVDNIRVFEAKEISAILGYFDDRNDKRASLFFRILLNAGLRLGEAMELTWDDIDTKHRTIRVRQSKSGRPRTVPINDALLPHLKPKGKGLIFPGRGRSRWYRLLREALRANDLPPGRPHDCRHTFGANLARAGVPLPVIQELLGHSSIQTTMIYVHFAPDHLRGAVNKVGW